MAYGWIEETAADTEEYPCVYHQTEAKTKGDVEYGCGIETSS